MQEASNHPTIPQSPPEILAGLSAEQFNLWRHQPVTLLFLRWVNDYANAVERSATATWLSGHPIPDEARGRVLTCREMAKANFEAISMFYGVEV